MTTTVDAIFENGAFRPVQSVAPAEGTRVQLVVSAPEAAPTPQRRRQADALTEIATMPREGPDDGFSGADHDAVLYPKVRS